VLLRRRHPRLVRDRAEIARAGKPLPLAVAETGTLPYLRARRVRRRWRRRCAPRTCRGRFPPRAEKKRSRGRRALSRHPACVDAIDVALTNVGPVIHPPLVLVNAGAIDRGTFDVHADGHTDSARRLIDAVDAERVASRKGWGFPAPHYERPRTTTRRARRRVSMAAGARGKLVASGLWNEALTFEHRYVSEDVELGLPFFESAARRSPSPPRDSGLLGVFAALLRRPLAGRGRDLDHLGLGELTLREVRELFHEGWQSALWPSGHARMMPPPATS